MSALPETPDIERLPCFATTPPAAAITNEAVVDMLNVCKLSPPVPHTSIIVPLRFGEICNAKACILSNIPSNSSSDSPLSRRDFKKSLIFSSETFPLKISSIALLISS